MVVPEEQSSIERARSHLQRRSEELSVEVRFVPGGGQEPTEVWRGSFFADAWEDDWAAEQLLAAIYSVDYPPSHVLSTQRSYVSWGASGVGEQLILEVAVGVVGSVVYDSLRGAIRRMRNRVSRENPPERILHRDEAESRARQATAASFDVGDEPLEVVSEEHRPDDGTWALVLEGPTARYEVVVADEFGSASVASVRRTRPQGP